MRYVAVYLVGENQPIRQQVASSEKASYSFHPGDKCKIAPISSTSEDQKYLGLIGSFTGVSGYPGKAYIEFEGRGFAEVDICNLVAPSLFG